MGWLLSGIGFALFFVAAQTGPPIGGVLLMAALLLLLAGLSCAAGYQIVVRRLRPQPYFRGPSPLLLFGSQLVLVNMASAILIVLGVPLEGSGPAFLTATIVLLAGYLFVVWLYGFRSGALDLRSIGVPIGAGPGRVVSDVVIGAGLLFLFAFVDALWGGVIAQLLGTSAPEVVPLPKTGLDVLLVAVGACVLIPIGEEIFFRGYSVTAWQRDLGTRSALIRSTIFFAVVHVANIVVEPSSAGAVNGLKQSILEIAVIAPVGLVLGWLFLRRGLLASIAGHAAFNFLGILSLLLVGSR